MKMLGLFGVSHVAERDWMSIGLAGIVPAVKYRLTEQSVHHNQYFAGMDNKDFDHADIKPHIV